ncbi:MAG TPA: alcohol dehydrogenase catalytic domain-containing protein [bacterium]|nr:alcohol dehydrogenase catalytic domain-containing protein [bacterium]
MQAIVVRGIDDYVLTELPEPEPGPGEVLLRVAVTGLCRTDLKLIRAGHRDLILPRVPGEEVVGTVVRSGVGVGGWAAGETVYVYPGRCCGRCASCRSGAENLCADMAIMGFHRDGGFAEYVCAPAASLLRVPDGLLPEQAVFAEPLSCCLNALELVRLQPGERIGIWGGGPAGTLLARAARAQGALPTVIEPAAGRRRYTDALAAAPADARYDAAVPAVGDPAAYHDALRHLAPRGRLVAFSGLAAAVPPLGDINTLHYHEQTVVGAYGCALRHGTAALALLAAEAVPVADLISHRLPLRELPQALDLVATRRGMKIQLYPGA